MKPVACAAPGTGPKLPAERGPPWASRHPSKLGVVTLHRRKDGTLRYQQKGGNQSTVDRNGVSLDAYVHALYGLALQRTAGKVLMIGCAGGTLGTMLARAGREVVIVDIDSGAIRIAKRHFGLDPSILCKVADGHVFLKRTRARFGVIIVDAFIGETIPEDLRSDDFFRAALGRLQKGGLVLMNVCLHGRSDKTADDIARGFKTLGSAVTICDERGGARNAIVCAGKVRGLRDPRVTLPPEIGAADLRKSLRKMYFRAPRAG